MKKRIAAGALAIAAIAAALALAGCSRAHSKVAVVDVLSLEQVWPKYINYYNQLNANLAAIRDSRQSNAEKQRAYAQFQQQEARWQEEVTADVRNVATDIAKQRGYQLVVTKQGVAYGGDDITPDVETALKIPIPTPSPGR